MTYKATQWIQAEALFLDWEIPYELVADVAIESIKIEEYSQVRGAKHRAPTETVERYMLMMRNGAKFPPIVVAANDKSVIDGNTRIAAARATATRRSRPTSSSRPTPHGAAHRRCPQPAQRRRPDRRGDPSRRPRLPRGPVA